MRWYADNSELNGIRGSSVPDILMFGGIAIPCGQELAMKDAIEWVKDKYAFKRAPVKWNFKDLKTSYQLHKKEAEYEALLHSSKDWRREIAKIVEQFDFKIIIAIVESHSIAKKTLLGYKPDLTRYAFNNGLMRFALHVAEEKPSTAQILLDWPDRGNSKPFDAEYSSAYNEGRTSERNLTYHSGPLSNINFDDSAAYVNMLHCTLLQFADLCLGATRELVECALGKKSTGFGVDFCKTLAAKYRGYPKNIFGRGISVASGQASTRKLIKDYIDIELSS